MSARGGGGGEERVRLWSGNDEVGVFLAKTAAKFSVQSKPNVRTSAGGASVVVVFVDEKTNGSLRIRHDGAIDTYGAMGQWARFQVEVVANDGTLCRLINVGHSTEEKKKKKTYLCYSGTTGLYASDEENDSANCFTIMSADNANGNTCLASLVGDALHAHRTQQSGLTVESCLASEKPDPNAEYRDGLEWGYKTMFVQNGFVVVRKVVPDHITDAALRAINRGLSSVEDYFTKNNDNRTAIMTSLSDKECINKLLINRGTMAVLNSLMNSIAVMDADSAHDDTSTETQSRLHGRQLGSISHQIALRYPADDDIVNDPPDLFEVYKRRWHIDGIDKGKMTPFSLLVGVALSDQLMPECGNLWTIPGSHVDISRAIQKAHTECGVGFRPAMWNKYKPSFEKYNPEPVLLSKGDIVVLHSRTAHAIGMNLSPNIRYQTYFRLRHPQLQSDRQPEQIKDAFFGFNDDIKLIAHSTFT